MPTIVYQTNSKTGVKYAYESVSYWDKDKKAPRSRRRYLGRVDPETGEIIEARKYNKKEENRDSNADNADTESVMKLTEELESRDALIASLQEELRQMTARFEEVSGILARIHDMSGSVPSSH